MSYENAPATKMLATHCLVCGRPLLDAQSVETGIGPICRKKFVTEELPDGNRQAANKLIYRIAALLSDKMTTAEVVGPELKQLRELGFVTVANKVEERLCVVDIKTTDNGYLVKAPFSEEAIPSWRFIGTWKREEKRWLVPKHKRIGLKPLLRKHYANLVGRADGTLFTVPKAA